jgi:pimeloyl-ACP methyl ester carboxylesterase
MSDDFSYAVMAEDLKRYCAHHQLDQIILLGHSMGGKTAMLFSTMFPEMVTKLLVADIGPKAYPQHHHEILKALSLLDFEKIKTRGGANQLLS